MSETIPAIWDSYKVVDILVKSLTPALTFIFGVILLRITKRLETLRMRSEKLLEKRIELSDALMPMVVALISFFDGDQCSACPSPTEVVALKGSIENWCRLAEPYFEGEVIASVKGLVQACFFEANGNALIRADRGSHVEAFEAVGRPWNEDWDLEYAGDEVDDAHPLPKLRLVISSLRASLGNEG